MKIFPLLFVLTFITAISCYVSPPLLEQLVHPRDDRTREYNDECETNDDCPYPQNCYESLSGGWICADSRWPPKNVY